eukprot:XP_014771812.1 PREDICTED: neuropeptide Y receptor type 2-like [Octopus bimaculoides]
MNLTEHGILDDNDAEFIDRDLGSNIVYNKTSNYTVKRMHHASFQKEILIPPYIAIFLLAVVGNLLVILTLVQNKRMRTVTNVFLLNLSISDLLLAVFCMPFTLIPVLLRNFIFGATMCVLIRYLQDLCSKLLAMTGDASRHRYPQRQNRPPSLEMKFTDMIKSLTPKIPGHKSFSRKHDKVQVYLAYINRLIEQRSRYRGIKVYNVKLYKSSSLFIFYVLKPIYDNAAITLL